MDVQTRSEETGLRHFDNVKAAFDHAEEDETVWKVSFTPPDGVRCRFVRMMRVTGGEQKKPLWIFEPLLVEEIEASIEAKIGEEG